MLDSMPMLKAGIPVAILAFDIYVQRKVYKEISIKWYTKTKNLAEITCV